jgi:hypothetical protein
VGGAAVFFTPSVISAGVGFFEETLHCLECSLGVVLQRKGVHLGRGIAYLQDQCNKDLLRIQKAVSSIQITLLLPEFTQTVGYSKGFLYSTLCTQQVLRKVWLLLRAVSGGRFC